MYALTERMLNEHGYSRYEISNYALPGFWSKHNTVYWRRGEYLGLGLGAASLLHKEKGLDVDKQEIRFKNNSDLSTYLEDDFTYEEEIVLSKREAMEEFFFLGLRMMQGVDLKEFSLLYGEASLELFEDAIVESIGEGLLEKIGNQLVLTTKGIDVSNYIFQKFLE